MNNAIKDDATRKTFAELLKQDEKEIEQLGEEIFGTPCHAALGIELEAAAVMSKEKKPQDFFLTKNIRATLFERSPYIDKLAREPFTDGQTLTHDEELAWQIEFVTHHQKPARIRFKYSPHSNSNAPVSEKIDSRDISAVELAHLLEALPRFANTQASTYNLDRVDFKSVPFRGELDQTCGLHTNISLRTQAGKNLFEDNKSATPLMMCFIEELLRADKDATALFCPSPEAIKRFKTLTAPGYIGLGDRRRNNNTGSTLMKGPSYNTLRAGTDDNLNPDMDLEPKQEGGSTRVEHRQSGPEVVTVAPGILPYVWIHYYLSIMKRTLVRYKTLTQEEKNNLDAARILQAITTRENTQEASGTVVLPFIDNDCPLLNKYPFPRDWKHAVDQFSTSEHLKEVLGGPAHAAVMNVLNRRPERDAATLR